MDLYNQKIELANPKSIRPHTHISGKRRKRGKETHISSKHAVLHLKSPLDAPAITPENTSEGDIELRRPKQKSHKEKKVRQQSCKEE